MRIKSIDVVRGAVMALMAIDHVRVFSGVPAGGTSAAVFFTRWITHFCAPAFVFLAGTSAFLYASRHPDVSRFLLTRGAWLIVLELTVLRIAWTFNLDFAHYMLAGVIWMLGWCMVLMAGLVKLPVRVVGAFGIAVLLLHNAAGPVLVRAVAAAPDTFSGAIGKIGYVGFFQGPIGPLTVLYSIVPWIGVMAAGYAFGTILTAERRDRLCLTIGLAAVGLFLILRGFNLYGDPRPWSGGALSFLNTTKYPASLSFLLMTLGPVIALMPLAERARGPVAAALTVFGRVPFFFYLLHIPLIHVLALGVSLVRTGAVSPWLFTNHPMGNPEPPEGYTWGLAWLYAVWAVALVLLYLACRWFAGVKAKRPGGWLRYV